MVSTHLAKDKNRDGRDVILKQDLGQNLKLVWFIFLSKKHQEISKTYHDWSVKSPTEDLVWKPGPLQQGTNGHSCETGRVGERISCLAATLSQQQVTQIMATLTTFTGKHQVALGESSKNVKWAFRRWFPFGTFQHDFLHFHMIFFLIFLIMTLIMIWWLKSLHFLLHGCVLSLRSERVTLLCTLFALWGSGQPSDFAGRFERTALRRDPGVWAPKFDLWCQRATFGNQETLSGTKNEKDFSQAFSMKTYTLRIARTA